MYTKFKIKYPLRTREGREVDEGNHVQRVREIHEVDDERDSVPIKNERVGEDLRKQVWRRISLFRT